MSKRLHRLLILLLPAILLAASRLDAQQDDSLRYEESIAREHPDLPFAASARLRLIRHLRSAKSGDARSLIDFMARRATSDAATWITPSERLMAETIIAEPALLRDTARLSLLLGATSIHEGAHPFYNDQLFTEAQEMFRHRSDAIAARLDAHEPTLDERNFFNLLINHLYTKGYRAQEGLNDRVGEFIGRYDSSPLAPLAMRYIYKSYGEVPFGAAFSAGYATGEFDGELGRRFNYFIGPMLAGELYIHRLTIAAWLNFGVAKAPADFMAGKRLWGAGNSTITNITLDAGWEFRFGRLSVTPLAGLGLQGIRGIDSHSVEVDDPPRTRDRFGYDIATIVGYRIPFDVGPHIDLRARVGRTATGLSRYDPAFAGSLWYVQLGFALVQRPYRGR